MTATSLRHLIKVWLCDNVAIQDPDASRPKCKGGSTYFAIRLPANRYR